MISPLPNLVRSDATFQSDVNNFFGGLLQAFVTQTNETATAINAQLNFAITSVTATSSTSVLIDTGSKSFTIETGKSFVIGMEVKVASTVNPANYMRGIIASYNIDSGALVVTVATKGGSGTLASWSISLIATENTAKTTPISTRTGDTILAGADAGTLIDVSSGTFSQTFTAAATLGAGWYVYYRNRGTGTVTLDPSGSETIDGLTTGVLLPGMAGMIICTGSAFLFVRYSNNVLMELLTSGTSWTAPLGVRSVRVRAQGGGGGGGRTSATAIGSGGAAGGYAETIYSVVPGTAYTYGIGAAGSAGAASGASGTAGGTTTGFGLTATGGAAGTSTSTTVVAGGTATGGTVNISGGYGIGSTSAGPLKGGGDSMLGGGGATPGSTNATAATGYGGGGGGGTTTYTASAGTQGCIILEY